MKAKKIASGKLSFLINIFLLNHTFSPPFSFSVGSAKDMEKKKQRLEAILDLEESVINTCDLSTDTSPDDSINSFE